MLFSSTLSGSKQPFSHGQNTLVRWKKLRSFTPRFHCRVRVAICHSACTKLLLCHDSWQVVVICRMLPLSPSTTQHPLHSPVSTLTQTCGGCTSGRGTSCEVFCTHRGSWYCDSLHVAFVPTAISTDGGWNGHHFVPPLNMSEG